MRVTLSLAAVLAALPSMVASTMKYNWRSYQARTCNHNAAPETMYPNGIASPGHATSGECVNIPIKKGVNYNSLEIDNDFHGSERSVQTFCVQNCRSISGYSAPQGDTYCYQPPKNCAIGSFLVSPI